jgi:methylenetetrahydrofolate reductase (NADPH)
MLESISVPAEVAATTLLERYSIEMTAKDVESLAQARNRIPWGTSISVTFLPGEEMAARVAAAAAVRSFGFEPVPHISARRLQSREELTTFFDRLRESARVERVFVVAGDPPQPMGPFKDALAVIESGEFARNNIKRVGIAGYPEGHPSIPESMLWEALRLKHRVLRQSGQGVEITTQFTFDSSPVLRWLERLREDEQIFDTVRVGLPGPATVKTLLRFASRCGVTATTSVMAKYGVSIAQLLATAGPVRLLNEFAGNLRPGVHGDVRLHLYPFGGLGKAVEWVEERKSRARRPDLAVRLPLEPTASRISIDDLGQIPAGTLAGPGQIGLGEMNGG